MSRTMRNSIILVVWIILLFTISAWSQNAHFKNGIRQGQIKVKFTTEMSTALNQVTVNARSGGFTTGINALDATAQSTKATNMYRLFPYDPKFENKLRKHGLHLWYVVELDETTDPRNAVSKFKQVKGVSIAEVEREKVLAPYTVTPYVPIASANSVLPFNDPLLKDQWHYNNSGQTGFSDADINLFTAWQSNTGSNDVIVAIHDEGVDVKHADLKANIWVNQAELNGQPGVDDDGNGYKDDINGYNFEKNKGELDAQYHGTHVAGTIAAVNNNGIGVSGVAGGNGSGNGIKIMSLQIFGDAPIEKTYVYAANNGAVISQNSWGYTTTGNVEEALLDAIDYFVAEAGDYEGSPMRGGIVIFAAGNSNYDGEWYPGYYESAFSVASIGPEWKKASYSNFGSWVELSAPGGDQNYGVKNGVLSTIPKDQYAYLQGTSMACPHVSGIAALALSNRNKQLTNTELWNKLVTGVVSIDEYNPDYLGKLGSGAIDASLAIKNNFGKAPVAISDLAVKGIAQEFAQLAWTVPSDEDDEQPISFTIYYHTQPITAQSLISASKIKISNKVLAGIEFNYELGGLLGLTKYYFAITSTDRWGNVSQLSNLTEATTNEGPSIAVDENSQFININIDASVSTSATADITILNQAAGILKWSHLMRHKNTSLAYNVAGIHYPKAATKAPSKISVGRLNAHVSTAEPVKSVATSSFQPIEKSLATYITNIVGETDLSLTNSAAGKFYVSEPNGFNLTDVKMYLKHDPAKGPVIVEVYKGSMLTKENLIYAQEYSNWSDDEMMAYITLDEQLFFESGSTFWVAFHVPADNLFPLGIGYESEPVNSTYCYMSFNMGATWVPLEEALNNTNFAWGMAATSYNEHLGTYLTLEPGSGDIIGFEQATTTLTANAATLINGTYNGNVILTSNDANNRELRVPVSVEVSGHKPDIKHIDIADFGAVFVGTKKVIEIEIDNQGYGSFNNPRFTINGSDFKIEGGAPWRIAARKKEKVRVSYQPTVAGNSNDLLTITNGENTYEIALFGVGAETSKISVTPEVQSVDNIAIGDAVNAQVTIENQGAFPLKYFIPGFDTKGISANWPTNYHNYGYKFRTNFPTEANAIPYEFQNISGTGIDITQQLLSDRNYVTVDMGFAFPYYGTEQEKIYIAQKGFTTFDNSVNPVNYPMLHNFYTPAGYISLLGSYFTYTGQGHIYYQLEADRMIIQYDNVTDGYSGTVTAQMVLFANGNIRFYYDELSIPVDYLVILMEDVAKQDGILLNDWNKRLDITNGTAIGFDYPGPNIISSIENGSGIIMPGGSAIVDVNLSTETLVEGAINRYISIINNDPANAQVSALVQLNVTSGGTAQPVWSTDNIAFGDVFQGAVRSQVVTVKNQGTANVNITSMTFANGSFLLSGDQPAVIKPGLYKNYEIKIPTANLDNLDDVLTIHYSNGTEDQIHVTGNIVVAPAVNVDLTALQETLNYGETSTHPLNISNPGLANLEVMPVGNHWVSYSTAQPAEDVTYIVERYNDGKFYQWIDIRETGTQLPFVDNQDWENTFWRTLELPFPIEFYGVQYTSFKIGDNGLISFDENPQPSIFTDYIPTATLSGPAIMPYWTFSGFSDFLFPPEDIGIFYQSFDDKFIITWSYFTNNFGGMGDPISAQVIFYKNGTMKFQYKREEGGFDLTSHFSSIGFQKNSDTGMAISEYLPLEYGSGLAYIISPANKYVVAPGETLQGDLKFDATNVYGSVYTGQLKIETNAPNQEHLRKQVELTVVGEAIFNAASSVDFGTKMVAFELFGSPISYTTPVSLTNIGAAPLEISWIQMADGSYPLSLQVLVDGWFGPSWVDIAEVYSPWAWETPVFTINPGDELEVRAAFSPSYAGSFADDVVFTTSAGEQIVSLSGTAVEPPAMEIDTTPLSTTMNVTNEVVTHSISISNANGQSDLQYEVSVDFGRATTARLAEAMNTGASTTQFKTVAAKSSVIKPASVNTYNRTISHTVATTPEDFVGTGGAAPLTLATKYNAGATGFSISHVEAFFRVEAAGSAKVDVEIRAGGTSITNAPKVAEGTLTVTGSADELGSWHTIALNTVGGIYPNEDFYVLITYPFGIQYPQGVITDEATINGRYLYYDEGLWHNFNEVIGFENTGWLMYAAEQTAGNTSWVSVTSATSGILAAGETSTIEVKMEGAFAKQGDQVANIIVQSNDPNHPSANIEATLHMNEAPHFNNVPEAVYMKEGEVLTLNMPVTDFEENTFTVAGEQSYANVTHTFTNNVLSVTIAPPYGSAGNYQYTYKATDQYNAISKVNLIVYVQHSNRAPLYIGSAEPSQYTATGNLTEYSISDYFEDPDGDDFTFTATSSDNSIIQVLASADFFAVKPLTAGEATITFVVTDAEGGTTTHEMEVGVSAVLGVEEFDVNFSLTAYPNPSKGKVYLHVQGEISTEYQARVFNSMGVTLFVQKKISIANDGVIELSNLPKGIYFIEVTDLRGRSVRRVVKE